MFIFKISNLFHLSTHFGVFLAWNALNNVISDKNMITEPCHRTNYKNKWDKTNTKFAKKVATFPYFFYQILSILYTSSITFFIFYFPGKTHVQVQSTQYYYYQCTFIFVWFYVYFFYFRLLNILDTIQIQYEHRSHYWYLMWT